jgi:hypothetical protein
MSIKDRAIFLSSIGFALGVVLCQIISGVISTLFVADGAIHLCTPEFVEFIGGDIQAFIVQSIVCGLYGSIALGGSTVYYLEKWSMLRAFVAHFLMTVTSYYLTGFFLRWFKLSDIQWCLTWLVIFIVLYTVIWLSNILSYRAQLKKINLELSELKMSQPFV